MFFKHVPKNCLFSMVMKSATGSAVKIFEEQKMEAIQSFRTQLYPDRFMDSYNLVNCTTHNEGTVVIEVRILKDRNEPFYNSMFQITVRKEPKMVDNSMKNRISMQMKELYESKKLSDYTLVVDHEEMKVHKAVLAGQERLTIWL